MNLIAKIKAGLDHELARRAAIAWRKWDLFYVLLFLTLLGHIVVAWYKVASYVV